MELEESADREFRAIEDARRKLEEPPPVRLVTVDDAALPATAGAETDLDAFYVGVLEFRRDPAEEFPVYLAENFALRFEIVEPPLQRDSLRMLGIEVRSLADLEKKLIERETQYTWQKGLTPGQDAIVLTDPAGNWLELREYREV